MQSLKKKLPFLLAIHLPWQCTFADEKMALFDESNLFDDIPLAVTASRLHQPLTETPVSMTLIDRDLIEASGALEIVDVLRLVPGMQVTYGDGSYPIVTYHGLSDEWSRRLQVQVDGRSIYMPLFSSVDWLNQAIALDDVQRIEVIRGSNAPVYGSNAFIGVINIITRQPFQDRGASIRAHVGSNDRGKVTEAWRNDELGTLQKNLDNQSLYLRYGDQAQGWDYRISGRQKEEDGFARRDDSVSIRSLSLHAQKQVNLNNTIDVQVGYSHGTTGAGSVDGGTILDPIRDRDVTTHYQYITWNHAPNPTREFNFRLYHNAYKQDDSYSTGLLSEALSELSGSTVTSAMVENLFPPLSTDEEVFIAFNHGIARRYDAEFQHTEYLNNDLTFLWGLGVRRDALKSRYLLGRDAFVTDVSKRLFGHVHWRGTQRMTFGGGVMLERNSIIGSHASSRVGATYALTRKQSLRAALTRGQRTPSLLEKNIHHAAQYADGTEIVVLRINDDNLMAEQITNYEVGYHAELDNDLSLDGKVFNEKFRRLIYTGSDWGYTQPTPVVNGDALENPFITYNGTDARAKGYEFQIKKQTRHTLISLQYSRVILEATHKRYINLEPGDSKYEGSSTAYQHLDDAAPRHTISTLVSHRFGRMFRLGVAFFRHSKMRWIGDGDRLPDYNRWDANMRWKFKNSSIALIGQNLFDDYQEFRRSNDFERRAFLQVSANF